MGTTPALSVGLSGGLRFPHIFGGSPPSGVVIEERDVFRGPGGEYLGIDGLCGMDRPSVEECRKAYVVKMKALRVGGVMACAVAVAFLLKPRA